MCAVGFICPKGQGRKQRLDGAGDCPEHPSAQAVMEHAAGRGAGPRIAFCVQAVE